MKTITKILVFAILFLTLSCKNECQDMACFTPPNPFGFELVDHITGENLFTNGTFSQNDIKVINLKDQSNVNFTFSNEINQNYIIIHSIGWKTEKVNYLFKIANESIFELYVDAERVSGDCCSYTKYNEVQIKNSEYTYNSSTGLYKILVN